MATAGVDGRADHDRVLIIDRGYRRDQDFEAVRQLLVRTKSAAPLGFNWEVRRWDGWRWYRADPDPTDRLAWLWFDGDVCVGAVHDEGPGIAVLEVDPLHRRLEAGMVAWAEEAFPSQWPADVEMLVHALDSDRTRREMLVDRGYQRTQWGEVARSMPVRVSSHEVALPAPYRLHQMNAAEVDDRHRLAELLNAAFGRDTHGEAEFEAFATHAASFRDELHLFAVFEDGTFASHAAANLDLVNRVAIIEPVCTHPRHRGHGLAGRLINEALRRAARFGVTSAEVYPGLDPRLNRFYGRLGFVAIESGHYWRAAR